MDRHEEYPNAIHISPMQLDTARRLQTVLASDQDLYQLHRLPYSDDQEEEQEMATAEDDEEDDQEEHPEEHEEELEDDPLDIPNPGEPTQPTVHSTPNHIPVILPHTSVSSTLSAYRCPNVQQAIFGLLYTVFTQLPTGQENRWHNPLSLFVPYISWHKDGKYIAPGSLTHFITAITFTARICMFAVMHVEVLHNPSVRLSR